MKGWDSRPLSNRKALIFSVITVLAILFLLEALGQGVRIAFKLEPEHPNLHRPHRTLQWAMRPHFKGTPGKKAKHYVETNSLGFRSPEIRTGSPRTWTRILVLGDSVSFGYKVSGDEAWPRILDNLLTETASREDAAAGEGPETRPEREVINTGTPGYGTRQEAILFEEHGPSFRPDLTILQFYPNDPLENYTYRPLSRLDILLSRSSLYNLLRAGYLRLRGATDYRLFEDLPLKRPSFHESGEIAREKLGMRQEEAIFSERDPGLLVRAWACTDTAVGMIAKTAREIDTEIIAVVFPSMTQAYGTNPSTLFQDSLAAICGRRGIPVIDLLPPFMEETELYDGLHPSKAGNEKAAAFVRERLEPLLAGIEAARFDTGLETGGR